MTLTEFGRDLWIVERPLSFLGVEMGTRMSVARLDDDALWVCSPVALDHGLREALDALGQVRWIVAPNRFHHLYVEPFVAAFPSADALASPGLIERRPNLPFEHALRDTPADWAGAIDVVRAEGVPFFDELFFHHRASRTLIVTDMLLNVTQRASATLRITGWVDGTYRKVAVPRSTRYLFLRDRHKLREKVEEMLSWDFDRLLLAHGDVVEEGAHALVEDAFSWLRNA